MTTNLLFITIYSGIGGGETLQLNLMRALPRAKYGLHVLTPSTGAFPEAAVALGAHSHVIRFRGTTTVFVPRVWSKFPIVYKLHALLRKESIQAVLSDYHSLPFVVPAAHSLGIPVIWNAMGWWFPIYPWQRDFFENHIDRIIAITGAVKQGLVRNPPVITPESIEVIIPGVDTDLHHPGVDGSPVREKIGISATTPLISMVARFQNVKGHEYFIEAARYILKEIPNAHFAVAGENVFAVSKDELYKQRILQMVQNDPLLRERIHYLGFWPDSREVIAAADVMICSSWFESLSMVALETMSMERPIVSTNVGGPAETVIDGYTGYLVPPRNSQALAERAIMLLKDPAMRLTIGKAARKHVIENFSAHRYADRISAVIDELHEKVNEK